MLNKFKFMSLPTSPVILNNTLQKFKFRHQLPKIIAFSGRKRSGKSVLTKICEKHNYKVLNFADELKLLTSRLLNISQIEMEQKKDLVLTNENKISLTPEQMELVANETNISSQIVKSKLSTPFPSIRALLQILGTDLIRSYNPDWHIEKIKSRMSDDTFYCFSDVRFPNEKRFIENIGGECWFIIRPSNFDISNHISETSLKWSDFGGNVIVNDKDKHTFTKHWENYLTHLQDISLDYVLFDTTNKRDLRNKLVDLFKNYTLNEVSKMYKCNQNIIVYWCNELCVWINTDEYIYEINSFSKMTPIHAYLLGTGLEIDINDAHLRLTIKDEKLLRYIKLALGTNVNVENGILDIKNPYIIENIKSFIQIPLSNELFKYFVVGYIDNHNCIVIENNILLLNIPSLVYENSCSYKPYFVLDDNYHLDLKILIANKRLTKFVEWLGEDKIAISPLLHWETILRNALH